jgi:hypothetical protein
MAEWEHPALTYSSRKKNQRNKYGDKVSDHEKTMEINRRNIAKT